MTLRGICKKHNCLVAYPGEIHAFPQHATDITKLDPVEYMPATFHYSCEIDWFLTAEQMEKLDNYCKGKSYMAFGLTDSEYEEWNHTSILRFQTFLLKKRPDLVFKILEESDEK